MLLTLLFFFQIKDELWIGESLYLKNLPSYDEAEIEHKSWEKHKNFLVFLSQKHPAKIAQFTQWQRECEYCIGYWELLIEIIYPHYERAHRIDAIFKMREKYPEHWFKGTCPPPIVKLNYDEYYKQ